MRARYGAGPLHLAAHVAALALCAYALVQIIGMPSGITVLIWMGAAVLLHDALLWPLQTVLDRGAQRTLGRAVNYVRIPAGLSLLLLLVFLPVISGKGAGAYERVSGRELEAGVAGWLGATVVLFALSGLLYLVRGAGRRRTQSS